MNRTERRHPPTPRDPNAPKPLGLQIAMAAYEEAKTKARAARLEAGIPLVETLSRSKGVTAIGDALLDYLDTIPWDDRAFNEPEPSQVPDGGPWCARCLGARWLKLPDLGNRVNAELVRCPDCGDFSLTQRRNAVARRCGLSDRERTKTFQNFLPMTGERPVVHGVSQLVKLLGKWARDPSGWIFLWGERGSGKTHLALAAANLLIESGRDVRWFYAPDLVLTAREKLRGAENQYAAFLHELKVCEVLILDDLGTVKVTDWAIQELLEPLLDARYRAALPTLLTGIGTPEDFKENMSASIGRRLEDPTVVTVLHNPAPQWKPVAP